MRLNLRLGVNLGARGQNTGVVDPYVLMVDVYGMNGKRLEYLDTLDEAVRIEDEIHRGFKDEMRDPEWTAAGRRFRFMFNAIDTWRRATEFAKQLLRESEYDGKVYAGVIDNYDFDDHNPHRMNYREDGIWDSLEDTGGYSYYPEPPEIMMEDEE